MDRLKIVEGKEEWSALYLSSEHVVEEGLLVEALIIGARRVQKLYELVGNVFLRENIGHNAFWARVHQVNISRAKPKDCIEVLFACDLVNYFKCERRLSDATSSNQRDNG